MVYDFGAFAIQISSVQWLAAFWTLAVLVAFNMAYALYLYDTKLTDVTRARKIMTFLLGSLVVVGTYADTLAAKPFVLKDCLLLALVAAHGWMAEDLVRSFIERAKGQQPLPPSNNP